MLWEAEVPRNRQVSTFRGIEMKKVFLGGTCNGSKWREKLIEMLKIDYFNPVVDDWDEFAYQQELKERKECDFVLYVITPKMLGTYAIAEVIDDSNKRPEKTIICVLDKDKLSVSEFNSGDFKEKPQYLYGGQVVIFFQKPQEKSLRKVSEMVLINHGLSFNTLELVAEYLNKSKE